MRTFCDVTAGDQGTWNGSQAQRQARRQSHRTRDGARFNDVLVRSAANPEEPSGHGRIYGNGARQ